MQQEQRLDFQQIPSDFYDSRGKIRLGLVRSRLLSQTDQDPDLPMLRHVYQSWRDTVEGLAIQRQEHDLDTGDCEYQTHWMKCSKRGNDVYHHRSKKKLRALELPDDIGDIEFWSPTQAKAKARFLFITLTTAVRQTDIVSAWTTEVAQNWNRWKARVRKKYGKFNTFRVFESTKKGYPHVHAVLEFETARFEVHRHINERGNIEYLVEDSVLDDLRKSWPAFIKVKAPNRYSRIVNYMKKRILHGTDQTPTPDNYDEVIDAGDLTMSLCWLFRKRSFAVSPKLAERMKQVLEAKLSAYLRAPMRNSNSRKVVIWVVLGVFGADEVGVDDNAWYKELNWLELGLENRMSREYYERVSSKISALYRGDHV